MNCDDFPDLFEILSRETMKNMTEKDLLEETLALYTQQGAAEARAFLEAKQPLVAARNRVQIENFRYCLAAVCGEKETALELLHNAIVGQGLWYRPAVFEDEDLRSLWEEPAFQSLQALSTQRYEAALDSTRPICTWEKKSAERLLLALHGNQQSLENAREAWSFAACERLQVDYFQSGEPDCYGLFRWEPEGPGPQQLADLLPQIGWGAYSERILGGFSAGCNVIARAVLEKKVPCDKIIWMGPWLPSFGEGRMEALCAPLQDTQVLIVVGTEDKGCLPWAEQAYQALKAGGVKCSLQLIPGLRHEFPENFGELASGWLKG